jgi:ABC-type transporter Mla subunit MlaD
MSKLDDLRKQYEEADAAAVKLSGEHQGKLDALVDRRQKLKDQYKDRIDQANQEAADAQARLMAYEAAAALLERGEEGESTLSNHTGRGGELLHEAYRDLKAERG